MLSQIQPLTCSLFRSKLSSVHFPTFFFFFYPFLRCIRPSHRFPSLPLSFLPPSHCPPLPLTSPLLSPTCFLQSIASSIQPSLPPSGVLLSFYLMRENVRQCEGLRSSHTPCEVVESLFPSGPADRQTQERGLRWAYLRWPPVTLRPFPSFSLFSFSLSL